MITYELALKLKEAGFPQPKYMYDGLFQCKHDGLHESTYDPAFCEQAYSPNLSELITSCGEEFVELYLYEKIWYSKGGYNQQKAIKFRSSGDCPEEAVANLWLMINKK